MISDSGWWGEYYLSGLGILGVSVVGVSCNIVSGIALRAKQINTNQTLTDLLFSLAMLSTIFLVLLLMLFSVPQLSSYYSNHVLPYIVPTLLPCTKIVMTGDILG